jgi:hypothetical protein
MFALLKEKTEGDARHGQSEGVPAESAAQREGRGRSFHFRTGLAIPGSSSYYGRAEAGSEVARGRGAMLFLDQTLRKCISRKI